MKGHYNPSMIIQSLESSLYHTESWMAFNYEDSFLYNLVLLNNIELHLHFLEVPDSDLSATFKATTYLPAESVITSQEECSKLGRPFLLISVEITGSGKMFRIRNAFLVDVCRDCWYERHHLKNMFCFACYLRVFLVSLLFNVS